MSSAFRESSHPPLEIRAERNGHNLLTWRWPGRFGSNSTRIGRIPQGGPYDSTGMNLLKRATLVTLVAGSGLLIATAGAAAAAATTTPADGIGQHGVLGDSQVDQTGEQGAKENDQAGEQGQKQNEQTGDQGSKTNDQSGVQGESQLEQTGDQGRSGE